MQCTLPRAKALGMIVNDAPIILPTTIIRTNDDDPS